MVTDRDATDDYVDVLFAGDLAVPAGTPLRDSDGGVPWSPLVPLVRSHALSFVNLECPLTERPSPIAKSGPLLWGAPALAGIIAEGGFSGVTLANNHVRDAGPAGVLDTIAACSAAGLLTVGAGADLAAAQAPLVVESHGLRIAVIARAEREFSIAGAQSAGAAPLDPWETLQLVRETRTTADVVLVVVHGGNEFSPLPRPGLVAACKSLVAAGANAVVCHHSHVSGPVATYGDAPVSYGTGNFLFPLAGDARPGWHRGYAVSLRLTEAGVVSHRLLPYEQAVGGLTVRPLTGRPEAEFLSYLAELAAKVADPDLLRQAWLSYCRSERRHYLSMTLGLCRLERGLLRLGVWPRWRRSRRRVPELLNVFTCDSHREAIEEILKMDDMS